MGPAVSSSKRREFTGPNQLEYVELVDNGPISSSAGPMKYGDPRIPSVERAVSLDFIKRRLVDTPDNLSARKSRRPLSSVSAHQLEPETVTSWPRLYHHSRSLERLPWVDRLSPIRDACGARPHSIEVARPKLRRRRERPHSLQGQRGFSSNRAVSAIEIPTRLASAKRLSTSTPQMDIGQSRSLDSVLAAAALLAEKELGSSFYSFSFTRSDCSNLPISLRSATLRSDNNESLPWPSRIKPL
ncbi:hypothetical protein MRX96_053334 [Rhipicephalus microplus]